VRRAARPHVPAHVRSPRRAGRRTAPHPLFADLPESDLAWIADACETLMLAPGDELFAQGAPADWMYLGLAGTVETRRAGAPAGAPSFTFHAGDVYGVIPFSRMQTLQAAGVVTEAARVARFPKTGFDALLRRVPALEPRFVAFLADRVRLATRADQQFEKLTALGPLSAGLLVLRRPARVRLGYAPRDRAP
jgi:signal-transduction protein with cAMP-binding, CBS, and nucleotidyltransferase domain